MLGGARSDSLTRVRHPSPYVIVQEIERYFPVEQHPHKRAEFQELARESQLVRLSQRTRRDRGYAFSQNESGQWDLMQKYDTTQQKPPGL